MLIVKDFKEVLYANVKLPKHGLEMKSNPLLILPTIEITNLKWDRQEERWGDILTLPSDSKGLPDGAEMFL